MRLVIIVILFTSYFHTLSQNEGQTLTGKISYTNSQNIYVRFDNTHGISTGDTLYVVDSDSLLPVLLVKHLSSISCVATSISNHALHLSDSVVHRSKNQVEVFEPLIKSKDIRFETTTIEPDNEIDRQRSKSGKNEQVLGRIALGSYTNFSESVSESTQRMRYSFSLDVNNINHSGFSLESYAMFRHTAHKWSEVQENLASALKIYNLAIKYEPNDQTQIVLGRKINRNISNIGAIDGLQVTYSRATISIGGIVGTRPDIYNYSLNTKLFQFGGFIALNRTYERGGSIQSSLAVLEQKYQSKTDRRFVYFQHSNSLVKNLNVFSSIELDIFNIQGDKPNSSVTPTSLFFSLNYRASRKWSWSASYDARKNVIYYESYKNFIDQLIDQETRQGTRVRFSYRPFKYVTLGSSAGYRFQKNQQNTSKNIYSFLSFSRVPWVKMSATISNTMLESNYLNGNIYGIMLAKDWLKGKLFSELNYRKVDYRYGNNGSSLRQTIASLNLTGRITRKLSVSVNYEATFERGKTLNRIYSNIIQRF
ncbi:MAG: hypothetical protein IPL46_06090 [Saprospiraceae bacterium]|nr:hypothetical protein [Saprospiraceae bacterium]